MDDFKYLIFDLVCDYLKENKTRANFRLVCSEFKIISANLFRRHYSVFLMNNILINNINISLYILFCDNIWRDNIK